MIPELGMTSPETTSRVVLAIAAVVPLICSIEAVSARGLIRLGHDSRDLIAAFGAVREPMLISGRRRQQLRRPLITAQAILATTWLILPDPLGYFALLALALTAWLLVKTLPWGEDAADQMSRILLIGGAAAGIVGSPGAHRAFLWFATAQLCLAYTIAGISKLVSREWRQGDALADILMTDAFGRAAWSEPVLRHSRSLRVMARAVIAFECAFPFAVFGPEWLLGLGLVAGFAFHLSTAIVMRLNTFLFAFTAAYPAILFCSSQLR